jgi:hypothetical protein
MGYFSAAAHQARRTTVRLSSGVFDQRQAGELRCLRANVAVYVHIAS